MARLAIQLAGAAAGYAIAGPFGASIGAAIGGYAGALIDPLPDVNTQGPRLDDQRVTSSAYGQMLTIVYGTASVVGNLIDASEYYETSKTETQSGGKGGGGQEVSTTTYTYSIDMAVALCEGELDGVLQIFANEKLIYDARDNAQTISPDWLKITIYLGTETQEPDPVLEAIHGAGNVPGYRGTAYVVFEQFQLQEFGNRPPTFRFVVASSAVPTASETKIETGNDGFCVQPVYDDRTGLLYTAMDTDGDASTAPSLVAIEPISRRIIWNSTWTNQSVGRPQLCGVTYLDELGNDYVVPHVAVLGINTFSSNNRRYAIANAETGVVLRDAELSDTLIDGISRWSLTSLYTDKLVFLYGGGTPRVTRRYVMGPTGIESSSWDWTAPTGYDWGGEYRGYCRQGNSSTAAVCCVQMEDASGDFHLAIWEDYTIGEDTEAAYTIASLPTDLSNVWEIIWDSVGELWWVHVTDAGGGIRFCSVTDAGVVTDYDWDTDYSITANVDITYIFAVDAEGGYIWVMDAAHDPWRWDIRTLDTPVENPDTSIRTDMTWVQLTRSLWGTASNDVYEYRPDRLNESAVPLSSAVGNVCSRVDIEVTDYDSGELIGDTNFSISRQASARAVLEELRKAYLFDHADTGQKIVFKHLGQTLDRTLTVDDIGAHTEGQQAPAPITIHRELETTLPKELSVTFQDVNNNYEPNTQPSRRLASRSTQKASVKLGVVLDENEGRELADVLLHLGHIEREHYELTAMPAHMDLIPTDVIAVNDGTNTFRMRLIEKTFENGLIRLRGVRDESSVLTSALAGGAVDTRTTAVRVLGITNLFMLDIPALRDADNTPGLYAAANAYQDDWPGSVLYQSTDGQQYTSVVELFNGSPMGWVTDSTEQSKTDTWCETMTLTVSLINGELSSVSEALALDGSSAAAWGVPGRWEIIIFQNATLQADGSYELDRIVRGRYGTEHAMDSHADSDYFVFLDADALRRIQMSVSEIGGDPRYYKPVTIGRTVTETTAATWAHEAVSLKPWAPANVQSSVDGSDNIDITWDRRDRVIGRALWDPPLSEDSAVYKVEIMDGETIKREINSTASAGGSVVSGASAEYTSADQVTDWGQNMAILDIKVYQYSQTLAAWGYPAEKTIGVVEDFQAAVLADSPICFYRFNEASGATAIDETATANGTYEDTNDAYQQAGGLLTDGKGAKAISIDNHCAIYDSVCPDNAVDVTYEYVFYATTGDDGTENIRYICDFGGAIGLYWDSTNGPIKTYIRTSGSRKFNTTGVNIAASTWYHIVLTFEDDSFKCYIDGVLQFERNTGVGVVIDEQYSSAGRRTLGCRRWEGNYQAKGAACRWSAFAAYNSVMNSAKVKQRFYATKASLK